MARYIFIMHEFDIATDRIEHDLPSDKHALEVAFATSKVCGVDLWCGERLVASVANGFATVATEKELERQDRQDALSKRPAAQIHYLPYNGADPNNREVEASDREASLPRKAESSAL